MHFLKFINRIVTRMSKILKPISVHALSIRSFLSMNSLPRRGIQPGGFLRLQVYRDVQWLQSPGGRAPGGDTEADPPKDTTARD